MKYRLIKTYPGSPELGEVHCSENKTENWKGTNFYEKYPEYWEMVNEDLWYVVFVKEERFHKLWTPYQVEPHVFSANDSREYFKTKEEAEQFILYNKPCLSYSDVCQMFGKSREFNGDLIAFYISEKSLKQFVKSKL